MAHIHGNPFTTGELFRPYCIELAPKTITVLFHTLQCLQTALKSLMQSDQFFFFYFISFTSTKYLCSPDKTRMDVMNYSLHCILALLLVHIQFLDKNCQYQNLKTLKIDIETAHPFCQMSLPQLFFFFFIISWLVFSHPVAIHEVDHFASVLMWMAPLS